MITALISRPYREAEETATLLQQKGYIPLLDPMLTIEYRMEAAAELEKALHYPVQAIAITSKNAADSLAKITNRRDLPILAVGDATAHAAREWGFRHVTAALGEAKLLMELITRTYKPGSGDIIYICADVVKLNIVPLLTMRGISAKRIISYYAHEAKEFSTETLKLFASKQPAIALFYSRRTAEIFLRLAADYDISHITAFALSSNVAHVLSGSRWRAIHTAPAPTQDAMMRMVGDCLA
jgi:uroporphyrinogen-III synthase